MKKLFTLVLVLLSSHIYSQATEKIRVVYGPKAICDYYVEYSDASMFKVKSETFYCFLLEYNKTVTTLVYTKTKNKLKVKKSVSKHHCMPDAFCNFNPWDYPPEKFKVVRPSTEERKNFEKVAESARKYRHSKVVRT